MNFANIYQQSEEKVRSMLLTFWTPGFHPMRPYVDRLLQAEPLMAEPVFQSIFPWETDNSGSWRGSLSPYVVDKLDIGKKFNPRTNQSESWKAAHDGNSIVVTSGTGSGKTECFMFPVLDTICSHRHEGGIQAIFLYPLNALMEDQRDRLDNYCKKLDLSYAVYNGATPEMNNGSIEEDEANGTAVEIRNRVDIRKQRPHIVLTNPSMLEYILVRDKDQEMLRNSQGKLRWIVIDEAHTFSGSSALELRWQIKRTLDAFGVTADEVQFACTSATIGDKESEKQLRKFISTLTGQAESKIKIISGKRVVPPLSEKEVSLALTKDKIELKAKKVLEFRDRINTVDGMSLTEIMHLLLGRKSISRIKALELIDRLCRIKVGSKALLALRAHFHMRTINGLYACGNPNCSEANHPMFGHITSHPTSKCSCGANMLELGQCFRCKTFVLTGKEDRHTHELVRYNGYEGAIDYFSLSEDEFDNQDIIETESSASGLIYLAPTDNDYKPASSQGGEMNLKLEFNPSGSFISGNRTSRLPQWISIMREGKLYCSGCGENLSSKKTGLYKFRIPVNLLNATLAPVFLNECTPDGENWGKYLAFTDSRQGTAKSAKGFNIEVERNISRKQAYEALKDRHLNPKIDEVTLAAVEVVKKSFPNGDMPQAILDSINNMLSQANSDERLTLAELSHEIFNRALYEHIASDPNEGDIYRKALLRQFLRGRALRGQNAETLGLMTILYEGLDNVNVPVELEGRCTKEEWHDFLKIILDYLFRSSGHVQALEQGEKDFLRDTFYPTPICSPSDPKEGLTHWPKVKPDTLTQSKLVRLLCIALDIHTVEQLNSNIKQLDNILISAFNDLLKAKLIKEVTSDRAGYNVFGNNEYVGTFYLDLRQEVSNVKVKVCNKAWICPVSQTFVDTIFKGYSPTMGSGDITLDALSRYKIADVTVTYDNSKLSRQTLGPLWSNFHDNVTDPHPKAYMAAEHSGQQNRELLKEFTADFKATPPKLNVLQCSTTMEMGVDIGDIDFVLLTTIPPTAANYMQRVGRAGRSGQTQAVAFSFCNYTPTGAAAFNNPMWAINTVNRIADVVDSRTILQRHLNAFFFREYLLRSEGMSLATTIGDFIEENINPFITWLDEMVLNASMQVKFRKVFGTNVSYTAERSALLIRKVLKEYQDVHNELDKALNTYKSDDRRKVAIRCQIAKLESENLLVYLSNVQFLPNASMPTGVMDFLLNDEGRATSYRRLLDEKAKIKDKRKNARSREVRDRLKEDLNEINRLIQRVASAETISRDGRLGLNEYAPGQTVVVNERNYPSAGILMRGDYGASTREKFLYICRNCGSIEYLNLMDEHKTCKVCNHSMNGILDNRAQTMTLVYEPVGFSSDVNSSVDRREMNRKQFYDIRPILLGYDTMQDGVFLTELSPSREYGAEILFCNAGSGNGFAICTKCGRAEIEDALNEPLPEKMRRHRRLDSFNYCDGALNNINRNVVLTSRLQTCYVVIAFKNADGHGYVNDEETALSLGVIIKRALANVLGIDESEIDFGVREERGRWLVFIFDTAKGGCGYSLYLKDRNVFQRVLNEALRMLKEDCSCRCEKTDGACPDCLSSRDTFLYDSKLSKRKALEWLTAQSLSQTPVPTEILAESPNAKYSLLPLYNALSRAVENSETKAITLIMSDYPAVPAFTEALDASSPLGMIVLKARQRHIPVRILMEFHPELYSNELDIRPFSNIENLLPGGEVTLVEDFGNIKPIAMVETESIRQRFITPSVDALEIGKEWGSQEYSVFFDDNSIDYRLIELPQFEADSSDILLEGITEATEAVSGAYFKSVIGPAIGLESSHEGIIRKSLEGKGVKVEISDPYMISPMSMIMTIDLVAEICEKFGCHPVKISVSNTGRATRLGSLPLNDYSRINANFASQDEADDFMAEACSERLNVEPIFLNETTAHYRYLRLESSDGTLLEIRPDHGFAGGWKSTLNMGDIQAGRSLKFVKADMQSKDILYYLLFKKKV